MNKEEIEFDIKEDIIFQIAMMSYNEYNDKIAKANEHIEIYSRQDIEEMEQCELQYEKHLGEIAIKQLQSQLTEANSKIEKIREYITSYESISLIQGLDGIQKNKGLNTKTMIEMTNRYLQVHNNILSIIEGDKK